MVFSTKKVAEVNLVNLRFSYSSAAMSGFLPPLLKELKT